VRIGDVIDRQYINDIIDDNVLMSSSLIESIKKSKEYKSIKLFASSKDSFKRQTKLDKSQDSQWISSSEFRSETLNSVDKNITSSKNSKRKSKNSKMKA